ncbi:acyl-ACP--UDP-N-acetylglucosamine O-acyltransferase [Rhodobacter sphaeroides]|jgi:acyl-[acyl-carrier-protein]--UDP-N-acetylglucosamine O-acyltransferase (EC 2.3.1.129)|uniref:Acyl-(Acyl-carrier-protein)--UDP-N-acetylglucosamine O-acyltransferase n=2 Tax=Cereibacter sphaeroides TaxID=1063 RepID=Q3J2W5_CERS4|nr:acyl-ACP--UDP-N-acetylglucosamine O-acyltransferase [Cereibacter sphaeroides]ABN76482.1 acyl-[acyl-carrier-protein]--UDP-N-acetylglucosamine O-acyltransferase [Cereibacter sphaeroides ATCC 17029]EKX59149.1 Acyl-[acyl-carrier-protein]-UDP-N-acetylglucosamine O-acyltransferase [Rhodobacter sp. AKP1]ABA78869.2 acyl-(acyl-carrier-protein)--UDP-N-acetylglucosamine O-acyltransferase [Cereibacter sphaeroides 2.4.1]ACM00891.1 UDP-N-acetylglucosamine acyltransferase [Cereibacter sphaeroides KD131]AM
MAEIHPSAIVEPGAVIGEGCSIGPFAVIGPEVTLGPGVVVKSHAVVTGWTEIGAETVIFPFAVVGEVPQDLKYRGERTRLFVGARCRIREGATLNLGTEGGGGVTRVGDDCLLMTGAHVGHDATLGNRVILANQAAIAGHCWLGDDVIVGGLSGVHQWVRVGRGAIIGAVTMVTNDVLPHGLVQAPRGELDGLNLVGLKRRGVSRAEITALRAAYQMLAQGEGTFLDRARRLADETESSHVREMTDFILAATDRSFLTPQ